MPSPKNTQSPQKTAVVVVRLTERVREREEETVQWLRRGAEDGAGFLSADRIPVRCCRGLPLAREEGREE